MAKEAKPTRTTARLSVSLLHAELVELETLRGSLLPLLPGLRQSRLVRLALRLLQEYEGDPILKLDRDVPDLASQRSIKINADRRAQRRRGRQTA